MVFVFLLLLEVFFVLFNKNRFFFWFQKTFLVCCFFGREAESKKKKVIVTFDTRQKKNLTTKAIHACVRVNVTCFYGGVFKYFEHHFHHCQIFPILLLWANVKCSSVCIPCTLRLNDAVVQESESSWGEWVFLIWNFSCNFIIIICSFLSAKNNAICTLQINQEKHLILPKIALCTLPIEWTFTCIQCEWGQTIFQNYLSIFPIPWPKSFQ